MGYGIRNAKTREIDLEPFRPEKIETMRMEHGRWCVERLRAGWRWGAKKDVGKKLNPCFVSRDELPEDEKEKDLRAVRNIHRLLAHVGLEIFTL